MCTSCHQHPLAFHILCNIIVLTLSNMVMPLKDHIYIYISIVSCTKNIVANFTVKYWQLDASKLL